MNTAKYEAARAEREASARAQMEAAATSLIQAAEHAKEIADTLASATNCKKADSASRYAFNAFSAANIAAEEMRAAVTA